MAGRRVLVRRKDESGSGFIFKPDDADKFLEANGVDYVVEADPNGEAERRAAAKAASAQNAAAKKKPD